MTRTDQYQHNASIELAKMPIDRDYSCIAHLPPSEQLIIRRLIAEGKDSPWHRYKFPELFLNIKSYT